MGKSRSRNVTMRLATSGLSFSPSPLVRRADLARAAGKTFDGKRDLYTALGYPRTLTFQDYWEEYCRGGISERIVEAYPRATWAGGADIIQDSNTQDLNEWESAAQDLIRRIKFWPHMERADILAGLGHYSVIILGAPANWETPITSLPGGPSHLAVLPEDRATIQEKDLVTDTANPRYGLPLFYNIKMREGVAGMQRVHWSRVIHMAEGLLDDDLYGKPRLRAVYNYLVDLSKVVGGGSEASWKRMDPGLHVDIDPEIELGEEEEDDLTEELDEYVHGVRRTLRTRGTNVTPLFANVATFSANTDTLLQLISSTTGIPTRILTGSERGQLASTQDRNNWNDRIKERRQEFATPIVDEFIIRMIELRALPDPGPDLWDVRWGDVESLDEAAKARAISSIGAANQAHFASEGVPIMKSDEIRRQYLNLGPIDLEPVPLEQRRSGPGGGGIGEQ